MGNTGEKMKLRCVVCQILAAVLSFIFAFNAFAGTIPSPRIVLDINEKRTITLEGPISKFSSALFIDELQGLDNGSPITIKISSPGGEIISGMDVIKAIQDTKSPVTCVVDRYAASMAALIAVQCPKLIMHKYGILMFHEYSTSLNGTRKDIKSQLDMIESVWEAIMDDMSAKTGIPRKELDEKVAKDWWLNAKEAKEAGLVSAIVDHYNVTVKKSVVAKILENLISPFKPGQKEIY